MKNKLSLSAKTKQHYMERLSSNLSALRAKAGLSQNALSDLIGVSRQTYCGVERGMKKMSWNVFMALIAFFDYHPATHAMLRSLGAFPAEFAQHFSDDSQTALPDLSALVGFSAEPYTDQLDEKAKHAIFMVTVLECARCMNLPVEALMLAFNESGEGFGEKGKKRK